MIQYNIVHNLHNYNECKIIWDPILMVEKTELNFSIKFKNMNINYRNMKQSETLLPDSKLSVAKIVYMVIGAIGGLLK